MSGLLSEDVLSHIGKQSDPRREIVTRRDIRKYAIATDNRQAKYLDGDVAPPLFHFFLSVLPSTTPPLTKQCILRDSFLLNGVGW